MQLRRARDGDDPRLLRQEPGERNLSGRRLLLLPELAEQIDQSHIRFAILRREARDGVAEVGPVQLGVFVDPAREEALSQGTERHEADTELLQSRYDFLFRLSPPKRVFALKRSYGLNGVGPADGLHAC